MDIVRAIDQQTIVFRLIEHRGTKMQRFAELIGYSWDYVNSIKVGRRPITDEFRRRCAAYFQMPEDVLFLPSELDTCPGPLSSGQDAPSSTSAEAEPASPDADVLSDPEPTESHPGASGSESEDAA